MDFEHLKSLVAAVEEGSLSAAGRKRNLTQPAVSLQIQALEEDVHAQLLVRSRRGVRPTKAGEALLLRARDVLDILRAARNDIDEIQGVIRGTLRLGVTDAAATDVLPGAFATFHREHPQVDVHVSIHDTTGLIELLLRHDLDLAVGTLPAGEAPSGITLVPLVEEPLRLAAPAGLGECTAESLLAANPFIAYPSGSNTRRLVDEAFARAGLTVHPAMEIGRPDVMVRLVEAGVGVSVLPQGILRAGVSAGRIMCPDIIGFAARRALGLLRTTALRGDPLAEAFAAELVAVTGVCGL